jgi:transposase-like protein
VKVTRRVTYLYRAVDQHGQVNDVLVSETPRPCRSKNILHPRAEECSRSGEVTTARAPVYPRVIDELLPAARNVLQQYANNLAEADHGRLKGAVASDARAENDPLTTHRRRRARVRAEPAPRALRDHRRPASP